MPNVTSRPVARHARAARSTARDERGRVADQVVGGQHQQRHVGADVRRGPQRAERDRRRGVAAERLEQEHRAVAPAGASAA